MCWRNQKFKILIESDGTDQTGIQNFKFKKCKTAMTHRLLERTHVDPNFNFY